MTDEELKGIAAQALNMAKRDLERKRFNFLLAVYHERDTHKLHRMEKVEKFIISKLGENWLNQGKTKDLGFGLIRGAVNFMPPDAVVFVTVCNMFTPTEKFNKLPVAEKKKLMDEGHDRHHEAVREGLLTLSDALLAMAQTPQRICIYQQAISEKEFIGQPETKFMPQEDFGGRLKMFGKESEWTNQSCAP
jgi:hypothetical protein